MDEYLHANFELSYLVKIYIFSPHSPISESPVRKKTSPEDMVFILGNFLAELGI